jgi:anti-anti-sigma factor
VKLAERIQGHVMIVDVHGPMVRDEAEPVVLLDALRRAIAAGQLNILLNVAEVTLVDSLWLGAVLQGYTTATRRGGTIKLLHVSRRFEELLAVTKLDRVLEAFDSEAAALSSMGVKPVVG